MLNLKNGRAFRLTPPLRGVIRSGHAPNDQRGITLQTLIITAVLVLMAVAAGVIIVAITGSASDDLEDQTSDLEARCEQWETHDLEAQARGVGGPDGSGGVTSSKVGCRPACYYLDLPPQNAQSFPVISTGPNLDDFFSTTESDEVDAADAFFFSTGNPLAIDGFAPSLSNPYPLALFSNPVEIETIAAREWMQGVGGGFGLSQEEIETLVYFRGSRAPIRPQRAQPPPTPGAPPGNPIPGQIKLLPIDDSTEYQNENHIVQVNPKTNTCELYDTSANRVVVPLP